MAFFARPNLDDTQFKQLSGSTLTLEGQTQIATTSGLTLTDGVGGNIPITASGASVNNYVLAYDCLENVIKLKDLSGGTGTGVYDCSSPTTCSVGGLPSGTAIFGSGITTILECILVPTVDPTVVDFFNTLSISPTTTLYEVGCQPTICAVSCFNRGLVNPLYCGTDINPAGLPSSHVVCAFGDTNGVTGTTIEYCPSFTPIIQTGNYVYSCVNYSSGATPVYRSDGSELCPVEPAGFTPNQTKFITGVYPWYWGTLTCAAAAGVGRPTACCIKDGITGGTLINGTCTKVQDASTGTLDVIFGSTDNDYVWFATPVASTTKTCWFIDTLNSGLIGGAVSPGGNTFPDNDTVTGVNSFESCWIGQSYKIYVSNKQSCFTTNMEIRNS